MAFQIKSILAVAALLSISYTYASENKNVEAGTKYEMKPIDTSNETAALISIIQNIAAATNTIKDMCPDGRCKKGAELRVPSSNKNEK